MCHRCFLSPLWTMQWYTIIILGKERKMQKIICNKLYDTTTATVVKKVTNGEWGDPAGYEETLYVTPEGYYFLYTFGGEDSAYATETIKRMSKKAADAFIENN